MSEGKKLVFALTIYDDRTFVMRSAKTEIQGKWSIMDSLMAAMTVLILGVGLRSISPELLYERLKSIGVKFA